MITKEELTDTINGITEKMNYISRELELLWQYTADKADKAISSKDSQEMWNIAHQIERLQFDEYANPTMFAEEHRFHLLYDILKENESVKNLDKLMAYEDMGKKIVSMAEKIKAL